MRQICNSDCQPLSRSNQSWSQMQLSKSSLPASCVRTSLKSGKILKSKWAPAYSGQLLASSPVLRFISLFLLLFLCWFRGRLSWTTKKYVLKPANIPTGRLALSLVETPTLNQVCLYLRLRHDYSLVHHTFESFALLKWSHFKALLPKCLNDSLIPRAKLLLGLRLYSFSKKARAQLIDILNLSI